MSSLEERFALLKREVQASQTGIWVFVEEMNGLLGGWADLETEN
jgi:hypothetical protein